mmetsp:Transcript_20679/g.39293  ORF Transcript_20679/g.39293 Transcript_20679/m.39293 type:complete len:2902 (+) Transcript_20679:155-8860(+)
MNGTRNVTIVPHGKHLSIWPEKIEFPNIQANMKYIQTLVVRNLSPIVKRIRCEPPKCPEFRLVSENQMAIAPGLSISIDVEFLTRKPSDVVDKITVMAEDFKFVVDLIAKAPCAGIYFDQMLNFGTVMTKRSHRKEIIFRNEGVEPGSFEISPPSKTLVFKPTSGRLAASGRDGDSVRVTVDLHADAPCTVSEIVPVRLEGLSTLGPPTKNINVYGTCVDQALHIFQDGVEIEHIDFGNLYHGTSKVVQLMLVNDGPTSCSFSAQVTPENAGPGIDGSLASSPAETVKTAEQPVSVTPFSGQIAPFGKIPLEFTFAPGVYVEDKGFICNRTPEKDENLYEYTGKIESEELGATLPLRLAGKALRPALRVSPDLLQFGECPVNQRRDIVLRLSNMQENLPLDFNIPRVPHMDIRPMKGRLAPLQNQNIVVAFMPKTLGKFDQMLVIKCCKDLYSHSVRCYGEAPIIGEKKIPVKGVDKTGRDFDPEYNYVNPEGMSLGIPKTRNLQSLTKIMKTDLNRHHDSSQALESMMLDLPEPTPYSLTPSAMQEFVRNKQKYNNHLKDSRIKRKIKEKHGSETAPAVDYFCEHDVNIGMTPGSGLKSPKFSVDEIPAAKLNLLRPLDDEGGTRGVTSHRYVHDENKLIKKKFKSGPTTQAEVRECSALLENWQLALISVGPKCLEFGQIYMRSAVTKSFSVYNDLPSAILVNMQYEAEEMSRSTPSSQVIPSAQAAGFDVTIYSNIVQNFQRQVVYTINGMHTYKLVVKAEITPVLIKMSRSELSFFFSEDNMDRSMSETLTLTNPGNAPARFAWHGMNSSFMVSPTSGVIRAGASVNTEVVFTPPNSGTLMEGFLTLKTEDGEDQSLRCSGQAPEGICAFAARRLDFGTLAVGLPADRTVGVVNNGKNIAVFHVENVHEGVTVSPIRNRINPEGRVDLNVHVILDRPMQLETYLTLNIRGGKATRLPIVATAVVPNIEFLEEEFDFGQLTLAAVATQAISLKNSSAVEGTLYVNLQPHPEFTIALQEERGEGKDEDGDFDSSALQPISLQQYQLAIGGVTNSAGGPSVSSLTIKSGTMMPPGGSGNGSPTGEDEDEETNSQIYKITVQPNYTLRMQLTYQPADLLVHNFEFPIVAAGGTKSEGLTKRVKGEAIRPRMLFSTTNMDFKTKVVATGIQSVASVQELALHNADDFPIEWKIDIEPLKKFLGVFTLEPNHGMLLPDQDCLVRSAFMPSEPVEYKTNLNVYISPPRPAESAGEASETLPPDESKPYLLIRMKGMGTVPKLGFDRREIVLPVVPLGIRSRCLFHILNEGYESLEVKFRLPTDNIRIPLTINFPEGQQLGITKPRIPVEIFFQSPKPISFCAKIEFLDNETGSYSLPVSGTTENCILTCHQYIQQNADNFYSLDEDIERRTVMLREKEDTTGGDAGAAPSIKTGSASHQSVAGYGGQDMSQVDFLVRWMNGNVLKNQLENFPQDLIASGGRYLYEMIEFLSGRQVPQKAGGGARMDNTQGSFRGGGRGGAAQSREMARIHGLIAQYDQLLTFLKQHGALLSSVHPSHFLSSEQNLRYQQSQNVGVGRRQVEKAFFPKSVEAWMTCILQTIKIFLLNRITLRAFRALPGMTDQIDAPVSPPVGEETMQEEEQGRQISRELQGSIDPKGLGAIDSNVYSTAECILLRWLNFHYWRANKDRYPPKSVCRFDEDLQDSIVISVVIQSHVPSCSAVGIMKYPCTSTDHAEENAAHIIQALQEIGLYFPIQINDIVTPQPKDMLLFVMFLYMNLPHYVPKTVIPFSTMLGVNVTKNIELTNPSRKAITYYAQLQGSSDFSIKEDQIKIEPRQTVSFPIEFQSRFSRIVEGQINFTSRREGNVHAAAMVFKLRSRCVGSKPKKTVPIAAVLYEVGTVDIELENPFTEDAEFEVRLKDMHVCDAERNPVRSRRCENVDPFHLNMTRLRVKANGTSRLTVSFLPFDAPAHFVALLGFYDAKAGEFYYELFGTSSAPHPLENYKLSVKAEEIGTKELILPHRNVQMERARMWLENRGSGVKQQLPDSIVYDVKLSSQFYTSPKQVTVVNTMGKMDKGDPKLSRTSTMANTADRRPSVEPGKGTGGSVGGNVAKLSLEFRPKEPGVYPCVVKLTSDVDIRIYQIEGQGSAPNTHCALTFNTQARKHVTQEIPIINPTDRDWPIKPTCSQSGHEFDGPREFTAKKRAPNGQATTSLYPLTFKPDWVCDVKGQLVLHNAGTNETYEYDLHGIAEEPLAEEHVVIKCEAREKTSHKFVVRNYASTPATFEVESDLVHISGPSTIHVQGKDQAEYELVFQPLQAGQVTGCIMFRDTQTGHFTWYTAELMTLPPKPQQVLKLTCVVRQAVAVDIQLVNPLNDLVVFEVSLNGDGLLGEAEFVLAPNETATYELVFSPLLPSKKKGTAVFFNDVVGEFWYDLELVAEPAPPEDLPLLECELGRTAQTTVKIDNPTGQEVTLKHRSTNKINFKVVQQRIVLPPLQSTTVTIEYSPSTLAVTEESQLYFEHPVVGVWVYKAQGVGMKPAEPRPVTVVSQVNRPMSSTITFRNPFLDHIHAVISLESRSDKGVFQLLNKKAKVQIAPLASAQIPFSFCPPSMTQHSAELAVSVVKPNLTWTYQIQGVAEAPTDATVHTFTVQARDQLEQYYTLNLVGLDTAPGERHVDSLSCNLEIPPQYQALVHRCFEIGIAEHPDPAQRPKEKHQVSLQVRLAPLRPFVAMCSLLINQASGGRWRFDLKLEATEPEVDDTISIQSPLNKPASVAFRLCNHTNAYAEFDAFFDAESAYEFTVQPTSGVLEPSGTTGTTFIITYKPTEYGKPVQGKLIIQTQEVYWSYLVRGTHPKYSAPVADRPKVVTRLSKDVQQRSSEATATRRKRNFIRDNMGPSSALRD